MLFGTYGFRDVAQSLLQLLEPFTLETGELYKTEAFKPVKEEDGKLTVSLPFTKGESKVEVTFNEKSRELTLYVMTEHGCNSCSSLVTETIPEEYGNEYTKRFENGKVILEFTKKEEEKNETCGAKELEELENQIDELKDKMVELDGELEDYNEKMHDAIDNEEFDNLKELSEKFRKTQEEIEAIEEKISCNARKRNKMRESLVGNTKKCCDKGDGCCHANSFGMKSDKWKRDEKGRFVKR